MRRLLFMMVIAGVAAACAAIGLACLPYATVRAYVDSFAGDGSAEPYTPALHYRLQRFFCLFGGLLILIAAYTWRARRSILPQLGTVLRRLQCDAASLARRWWTLASAMSGSLVAITLLAATVRAIYIDLPMRFDESYTYLNYASQPWFVALSKYDAPNNHVFHSLCVLATTRLLGDAPWVVRLPAFMAGVLTVPATMLLTRQVGGRIAAVLAGLIVATSSPLIEYSTNARGYTLICLFTVLAWLVSLTLVRRPNLAGWLLLVVVATVGCWTIPTMLYPLTMLAAWLTMQAVIGSTSAAYGRRFPVYLAAAFGIAALLTIAVYSPVLLVEGPRAVSDNVYVQGLGWGRFFEGVTGWLQDLGSLMLRDVPGIVSVLWLVGFVAAVSITNRLNRLGRTTAVASLAACVVVCLIQRVLPFPRVWLFLLPLAATLVASGLADLVIRFPRGAFRRAALATAALMLAVGPLWRTVHGGSIPRSYDVRALAEGEQMAEFLQNALRPGEPVVAVCPSVSPLIYYATRKGVDPHHFDWPATEPTPDDSAVIVVNRIAPQTIESVLAELGLQRMLIGSRPLLLREYPSAWLYRLEREPAGPSSKGEQQ